MDAIEQKLGVSLKPEQKEALDKSIVGDTLCVLPTGYGKTMIIKALPYTSSPPSIVIVVSPLNCILDQQEKDLGPNVIRIPMEELSDEKMSDKLLSKSEVTHIIGHPEQLMSNSLKKALMSHMGNRKSFRPAFSKLSTLRAILPGVRIVALTATANEKVRKEMSTILGMTHYQEIVRSPDSLYFSPVSNKQVKVITPRSNILLRVVKDKGSSWTNETVDAVIDPILIQLNKEQQEFERIIIYAPLKWCEYIHERAVTKHMLPNNTLIGQYHAPQTEQMKSSIGEDLKNSLGQIRLLLATEAYGMGADCSNIHRVLHLGPPNSIETYIQEIGRAGRDGQESTAVLYYNKSDISNNKINLSQDLKNYINSTDCRRAYLLSYFGFSVTDRVNCCDVCLSQLELQATESAMENLDVSLAYHFNSKQKQKCKSLLCKYFRDSNNKVTGVCVPEMVTGLSCHLLAKIMQNVEKFSSADVVKGFLPDLQDCYAKDISDIISSVN